MYVEYQISTFILYIFVVDDILVERTDMSDIETGRKGDDLGR